MITFLVKKDDEITREKPTKEVAALYVATDGPYYGLPGVHPYDENEDARMYQGPWPIVAHPPCQRWGKFAKGAPLNIKNGKVERIGDDQGCFKSALFDVRRFGGVVEHPEHSKAWAAFGLTKPPRKGGWVKADEYGWTCRVEQGRYGHYFPKPTWLYVVGVERLPDLRWGVHPVTDDMFPPEYIEKYGREYCRRRGLMSFQGGGRDSSVRIHTPPEFRDLLIDIARKTYD